MLKEEFLPYVLHNMHYILMIITKFTAKSIHKMDAKDNAVLLVEAHVQI